MAIKQTEASSIYSQLENMGVEELLLNINHEDKSVPTAIEKSIPQIAAVINAITEKLNAGGRLFYIGSGTSGRLGIVDASECPPTFGVEPNLVNGIIAGGDAAIRSAQEFAEDNLEQGWIDLQNKNITTSDFVIGISASGTTPYVIGAMKKCRENNIATACITCNSNSELAAEVLLPIEIITGPEFITGSTRMKAGTAQKLVLNMISTTIMIQLGHVMDNQMVDMQLTNEKLIDRGSKMLMKKFAWNYERARYILLEYGSVRKVMEVHKKR